MSYRPTCEGCVVYLTASTNSLTLHLYSAESVLRLHGMKTHVAFLHDEPLDEIMAGRKRFEFRLSFGGLACRSARAGDRLLLKRSGGEVESA